MTRTKRNCYGILGVSRDSSNETIRRAYVRLTALFEPDNPTLYGLYDEADSRALLGNIRHAYRVLSEPTSRAEHDRYLFPEEMDTSSEHTVGGDDDPQAITAETADRALVLPPSDEPVTPGRVLKVGRQRVGYSIEDIADRTKIAMFTLRAIEGEQFGDLPALVYVRGFLRQIVQMIRLDDDGVVDEYCRRLEAWQRSRDGE
ncbi:MAG: helix-turn-helix domain-containing protein [Myxococcota bacterium]|nr:helix-turn-helix domain-containing protein [Myxococcota bacterium]